MLHGFNVTPPGILFYQTDIDFLDSSATYFWRSLGFPISEGQFIDEGRKLFFKTELSYRYAKDTYSDMIFVYHDKKIALEAGFLDPSYQILHEFCWDYACDIFKFQFLDILNNYKLHYALYCDRDTCATYFPGVEWIYRIVPYKYMDKDHLSFHWNQTRCAVFCGAIKCFL